MQKIIVILGPTASGKSFLAEKLANRFNGEIISADSRQIYKKMDIGTNKFHYDKNPSTRPDKKSGLAQGITHYCLSETERSEVKSKAIIINNIPHCLISIINPNQKFSLAQYKKLAIKTIKDIHKRGKIPFLVGGAGLYIQAIVDNLDIPQVKPDLKLRSKIEKEIKTRGLETVYKKLIKLDPQAKNFIDPKNPRRIIRALEVCLTTGQPFSKARKKGRPLFKVLQIGLKTSKKELDKKISQRTEQMFKSGLINEVQNLLKKYSPDTKALSGIGYQEIIPYLQNKITLEQVKKLINLHTRQYAKRQITWFKKIPAIKWTKTDKQAIKLIKNFLK